MYNRMFYCTCSNSIVLQKCMHNEDEQLSQFLFELGVDRQYRWHVHACLNVCCRHLEVFFMQTYVIDV